MQTGLFSIHWPKSPTFYSSDPKKSPSTLDIILTNISHNISDPKTVTQLSSDHLPVVFKILRTKPIVIPNKSIFNYRAANWESFQNHINNNIDLTELNLQSIKHPKQLDHMIKNINNYITHNKAHNIAVPRIKPSLYNIQIPEFIKDLITRRNLIRRKWQRHRKCNSLKQTYTSLNVI